MEVTTLVSFLAIMVAGVDAFQMSSKGSSLVTHEVFFDMTIAKRAVGRITLGLFGEMAPKAVENFLHFSTQPIGKGYKGSVIHRVAKGHLIQGGDFIFGNGTGKTTIFDDRVFEDESFVIRHSGAGWLGMANAGKDTNTCQFYITFNDAPWMDGKHVIFGKVLDGMEVASKVAAVEADDEEQPRQEIMIANCGEIPIDRPFRVNTKVGSDEL